MPGALVAAATVLNAAPMSAAGVPKTVAREAFGHRSTNPGSTTSSNTPLPVGCECSAPVQMMGKALRHRVFNIPNAQAPIDE